MEQDPYGNFAGWVYFAIDKIAEKVKSVSFRLYQLKKNGDVEEIDDHALLTLLHRPNPFMTKSDFFYLLAVYMKMWGASPVYKEKMGNRIINLWPMRPDFLKMKQNDKGDIVAWEYWVGGQVQQFKTDEIVYIRKPDPKDPLKGFGSLFAVALEVDTDLAAAIWNKTFFDNNAEPGGVLETDQQLSDESYERLKKSWDARYKGAGNSGKLAILEAGLKWKATEQAGKEVGYLQTRTFHRDAIITMLGLPKGLYIADDVNLANAEVAHKTFMVETITPLTEWIFDQLNEFLIPSFGDSLWLDFDSFVDEAESQKLEESKAGTNVWQTVNETRSKYKLAPLEGGDVLYMPIALVPQIGDNVTVAQNQEGKGFIKLEAKLKTEMTARQKQIKQKIMARTFFKRQLVDNITQKVALKLQGAKIIKGKIVIKSFKQENNVIDERMVKGERKWNAMIKAQLPYENLFKNALKKYFAGLREKVIKSLSEKSIINDDDEVSAMIEILTPLQWDLLEKAGKRSLVELGLEDDFVITPSIADVLKKYNLKLAKSITEKTRTDLEKIIADNSGIGSSELAIKINEYFDFADEVRASRIARTETIRTSNQAMTDAWTQSGVVESKEWYTAADERTCSECVEMDGKTVGLDENYFDKGSTFMGMSLDFRDIGEPPLHANCRCTMLPVVKQ